MAVKVNRRNLNVTPALLTGGPCTMYALMLVNNTGQDAWVQLFDSATPGNITPSITPPDHTEKVAAGQMINVPRPANGVFYAQGIVVMSSTADMGNVGSTPGVHVYAVV